MARERIFNHKRGGFLLGGLLVFAINLALPQIDAGAQSHQNMADFSAELSNFLEPSLKTNNQKDRAVARDMRDLQRAAELYACFYDGRYPTKIDDAFKKFFHGKTPYDPISPFSTFINPFTEARQWPELGSLTKPLIARQSPPFSLAKGVIKYCPIDGGNNYAIVGGASNGKVLSGIIGGYSNCKTYVLTRDPVTASIANMRFLQVLLGRYSQDHQDFYPRTMDADFKSYFPGGNPKTGAGGKPPINPYTGKREWPQSCKFINAKLARLGPRNALAPGCLEYAGSPARTSFIIRVGGPDGKALQGAEGKPLIYGRDGDGSED